jgi:hypothetical protein
MDCWKQGGAFRWKAEQRNEDNTLLFEFGHFEKSSALLEKKSCQVTDFGQLISVGAPLIFLHDEPYNLLVFSEGLLLRLKRTQFANQHCWIPCFEKKWQIIYCAWKLLEMSTKSAANAKKIA